MKMHIHTISVPPSTPMTIRTPLRITQTTTRTTILITTTSITMITIPTTATNPVPP